MTTSRIPITLNLKVPDGAGPISGHCEAVVTCGGRDAVIDLPLTGSVKVPLKAVPAAVIVRPDHDTGTVERHVTVRRTDGDVLAEADSIKVIGDHVEVASETGGGGDGLRLVIRIDAGAAPERLYAEIEVKTPDGLKLRVPVVVFKPAGDPAGASHAASVTRAGSFRDGVIHSHGESSNVP